MVENFANMIKGKMLPKTITVNGVTLTREAVFYDKNNRELVKWSAPERKDGSRDIGVCTRSYWLRKRGIEEYHCSLCKESTKKVAATFCKYCCTLYHTNCINKHTDLDGNLQCPRCDENREYMWRHIYRLFGQRI